MKTSELQQRVERLLYGSHGGLNLKRPDIAALAKGQTVAGPIEVCRDIEGMMLYMLNIIKEARERFKEKGHWSSCALHNGPAFVPEPCDCGVDPSMTPEAYGSEFPNKGIRVGKYLIEDNGCFGNRPDKIWIQITDDGINEDGGEGREFNKEEFLVVLDKFYNDNF